MSLPRGKGVLLAVLTVLLVATVLLARRYPLCPYVPISLSLKWKYAGTAEALRIYDVNAPPSSVVQNILSKYPSPYYYARAENVEDLNLQLPDLPTNVSSVYMVTVKDFCGFETYAVAGSDSYSRIYVGIVPLSSSVVPVKGLFCEGLASRLGNVPTVSELSVLEGNVIRHYCYLTAALDENSIRTILQEEGNFVARVGNAEVYALDDNIFVNLVPGEPAGLIAYRVDGNAP